MAGTITHYWNGTVLTVSSDSGTSSADLKGDDGPRGPQGLPGDCNLIAAVERAEAAAAQLDAGLIKTTATGEAVSPNDKADGAIIGLNVYGKSTQSGTPTPTAPIDIVSVDNPNVIVCGINLCNMPEKTQTINGVSMTSAGGIITVSGTATAAVSTNNVISHAIVGLPAGKYNISGSNSNVLVNCFVRKADGTREYYHDTTFSVDGTQQNITVYIGIAAGITANTTVKPMLVCGNTAKPWVKYEDSRTMPVNHTLRGIPVSSGGNYTDSNGKQWICDEVDYNRGKYIQRIAAVDANTLNWMYSTSYNNFFCNYQLSANGVLCNAYKYLGAYTDATAPNTNYTMTTFGNSGGIRLVNTAYTDAAALKAALAGVIIYMPLETPTETDLTEIELAAFAALETSGKERTFYTDQNAGLCVNYVADSKAYIDNKFMELQTALVALGG